MGTDLRSLATEINREHEAVGKAGSEMLAHARRAGDLLLEAKGGVTHGEWMPWVKKNFAGSHRTANDYMRVAERWPEIEKNSRSSANLGVHRALALIAEPRESDDEPEPDTHQEPPPEAPLRDEEEVRPEVPSVEPEEGGAAPGGAGSIFDQVASVEPDDPPKSKAEQLRQARERRFSEPEPTRSPRPDPTREEQARAQRGNAFHAAARLIYLAGSIKSEKNVEHLAGLIVDHPEEFYADQRFKVEDVIEAGRTAIEWLPAFVEAIEAKNEERKHGSQAA